MTGGASLGGNALRSLRALLPRPHWATRELGLAVAAPEHEQGHEVVGVSEAVAHPHRHLDLVVDGLYTPVADAELDCGDDAAAPAAHLLLHGDDLGDLAVGGPVHPVAEQLGGLGAVGCPEDGPQVLLGLPGPDQPRAGPLLERLEPRPLAVGEVLGVLTSA